MTRLEQLKDFIRHWWEAKDMLDFCTRTGLDRREASNLAASLRDWKVKLRAMPPGPAKEPPLDRLTISDYKDLAVWSETCASAVEGQRRRQS